MEKNGGMVAVVQGLQDSGLTVTLMDGGKQYTLMPEASPHPKSPQLRSHTSANCALRHQQCATDGYESSDVVRQRENGVQATDGRYASTYKMMHCHVNPTSPTHDVTEFPPQRPEVIHGHGNFVVGGYGSGETFCQTAKTNNFRGGMCWPDKGSVCASRPSVQPDAFANSLRKYPSLSPERSTEIVERLITFTQAKNMSRNQNRCCASPTRNSTYSDSSKHTFLLDRNSSKIFETKASYKPDVTISKRNRTTDNSPVRDRSRQVLHEDTEYNSGFCRHNDATCIRDGMRQFKDGLRNLPAQPYTKYSPRCKEQFGSEIEHRRMVEQCSNNSVNIEIQAAAQMESKEILTLPRIVPMQKTIATSLSPVSSKVKTSIEARRDSLELSNTRSCKSIQVKLHSLDHAKATSSSVELKKHRNKNKTKRSKSEEELDISKKSVRDEILKLLQGLNSNSNCDLNEKEPKSKTKKVCRKCKHIFEECARFNSLRRSVSDYACIQEDSNANFNKQKANTHIKNVIRQCLNIKGGELGEKVIYRDHILQEFVNKLQFLASRSEDPNNSNKLNVSNKSGNYDPKDTMNEPCHYNDLNDEYVLKNTFTTRKRWHKDRNSCFYANDNNDNGGIDNEAIYNHIVTKTEEELRNLIDLDVLAFTEKYRLNITTESLYDLREELFDLLVMNLKNIASHNRSFIKKNIKKILQNRGFSEFQSVYLTNILTEHWEDEFSNNDLGLGSPNLRSDTFIIFPNITQNSSKYNKQSENSTPNEPDFSINEISQKDLDANVHVYVNRISDEINEWLLNLPMPMQDAKLREAIVNDLANDIVDRHKYLELNPSSTASDESELENLKYQVFKWIYKLANNVDMTAVEHADDLMKRIQSIPVPIFSVQHRKFSSDRPDRPGLEVPGQRLNVIEPSNLHASSTRRLSTPDYVCCKKVTCKRNLNRTAPSVSTSDRNNSVREPENLLTTSARRKSSPAKLPIDKTEEVVSLPTGRTSEMNGTQTNAPIEQHPISTNTGDLPYDSKGHFTGGIRIRDDEDIGTEQRPLQGHIPTTQNLQTDIDKINEEYNDFLKQWVQTIPILITNDKDENMAKSARKEIYDSIWEIISKLRSEPQTFNNRFLCEDIFDDEIEKLLGKLPQSSELRSKKHVLKVKLIEKTSDANELIKSSLNSYKQQLIESVKGNVPKPIANECQDPDVLELYEELQILNLVEDFIIWSRYQNEDPVTSEGYRNKLLKRTKTFVEELKANHSKALKNIDTKLYLNDILNALKNVPLPSDETIQQEADEILLGVEIEKWFSELPVSQSDDYVEQLHRRRLRNNLAKQIRDKEKDTDNLDGELDNTLRHEVSQFLGKAPLQTGESLNINVMVDELMQRLKNRPKSIGNDSKRVAFNDPGYEEFSRNMPLSSTITGYRRPSGSNNIESQNISALSNKSIQAMPPNGELYHNIAKPLLDDLRSSRCCDDYLEDLPDYGTFANDQQINSSQRNNDRWYTLQDSRHEYPEANNSRVPQTSRIVPHPAYSPQDSRYPNGQDHPVNQYGISEFPEHFSAPQKYAEQAGNDEYSMHRRPAASFPDQRNQFKRVSVDSSPLPIERHIDTSRRMSDQVADQRYPGPHLPQSQRRSDDIKLNQRSMRSDHIISPHRTPYQPMPQQEPERFVPNIPHTLPDNEDQHSPQMNRSGVFRRSTDQEGIRQIIEHNKSMEATYGGSIPEHYPGYFQPSVILPPGDIPMRMGTRGIDRDRGRYIAEGAEGRHRVADTDVDIDEEEDIRCRCEKVWKSRRRPRYCPFDDYDGYPMCLSTPYFYPYFY